MRLPQIFAWIVELAEYERGRHEVTGNRELLGTAPFGTRPSTRALIAELDGRAVGFALFHGTFSTWECRPGIWLEDLYVPPEHRRGGVAAALVRRLAEITLERGGARLESTALDWIEPALSFYEKLGAEVMHEWRTHQLDGDALQRVAGPSP